MKNGTLLLTLVVVAGLMVAACGPAPGPTAAPSAPAQAPAAMSPGQWDALVAAARQEGKVMIYRSGVVSGEREAVIQAFKDAFGIDVEYTVGGSAEILERLDRESRAGLNLADVAMLGGSAVLPIKPLGLLEPLPPLLALPEVIDASKWQRGKIPFLDEEKTALSPIWFVSPPLTINTELVKPGEIQSNEDFLAPKWKGQIVLDDPTTFGLGANWFSFVLRDVMGIEKGQAFWRAFARQEPVITRDRRQQMEWVARGKYPMSIGTSQDAVNTFVALGAPLSQPRLKEPFFVALGSTNVIAFKKASHPNAKKLFVNWILSKAGASVISRTYGAPSTRIDVPTEGINPVLMPLPQDVVLSEAFYKRQTEDLKLAGEVFAALLKK
ncbi:MAG: extracellular solute-binding protein [Chloroflexi bacterium]|nr:extracellular solute-binding protein [Chloroflexota bacterium]